MYLPLCFTLSFGVLLAVQHRFLRPWEDNKRGKNDRAARHKRRSDRVDARWAAEDEEYRERRAKKKMEKAAARVKEREYQEMLGRGEIPRAHRERRWVYGTGN